MARAEMLRLALCLVASALAATGAGGARKTIGVYELRHGDFSVKITNWGTTIMSVILPDSKGAYVPSVLSCSSRPLVIIVTPSPLSL
jgi:aldose 1-epimerase